MATTLMRPIFFERRKQKKETEEEVKDEDKGKSEDKGKDEEVKEELLKDKYIYFIKEEDLTGDTPQKDPIPSKLDDTGRPQAAVLSGKYYIRISDESIADPKKIKKTECFSPIEITSEKEQKIYLEIITIQAVIDTEYKVVLFDKGLSQHQDSSETPLPASPTCIQVYIKKIASENQYKGEGTLKCSNSNVEFYLDKEYKTVFDINTKITFEQLTQKEKFKIYLKGKTAGKFDLTLELDESGTSSIITKKCEQKMGVVKIETELYQYDTSNPPAEVLISDEDKIKKGRLLHKQIGDNHGRAKLILKKIDSTQWPDGCDDYIITMSANKTGGQVILFDAAEKGNKINLPYTITKKNLESADQNIWVEGNVDSDKICDAQLDFGIDRPDDKDNKLEKEIKHYGDFMRFTVVTVERVAPEEVFDESTADAAKLTDYKGNKYKVFINTATANVNDKRKLKIKAKLSKKLQGIKLYFMLAPDKDNGKAANYGYDLPGTWNAIGDGIKHKDKANKADYFHYSADTNADGEAEKELELSRFGRDIFKAGIYISQDVHLAEYIHGDAVKGKREPVLSKNIKVWRKAWFQMTSADGFNPPDPTIMIDAYKKVGVDEIKSAHVKFLKASAPARTYYPKYMFDCGTSTTDVAVIGNHNKSGFFKDKSAGGYFDVKADEPHKVHIVICEKQWDKGKGTVSKVITLRSRTSSWINMGETIITPPLEGGNLVDSGKWELTSDPTQNGALTDADIIIDNTRTNNKCIKVKLPALAPTPWLFKTVKVTLKLKYADGPYLGESSGKNILAVYEPSDVTDYNNTITHEIGHSFGQVPKVGAQHASLPAHPNQFMGQGNHCNWNTNKCVMYESGPVPGCINKFCEVCHPYLLVQDMDGFNKNG